jgi:hypothetical protein
MRSARRAIGVGLLVGSALVGRGAAADAPVLEWRRIEAPGGRAEAVAVAAETAGDALAVADPRGVWVRRGGRWRRSDVRGAVRDLAFDAAGALWIASERGLLRLDASHRLEDRSPGAGARDRDLARVVTAAGQVATAGVGGVFVGPEAGPLAPVRDRIPAGAVTAIALRFRGDGAAELELWLSAEGELWRVDLAAGAAGPAERVALGGPGAGSPLVDLARDAATGRLIALGTDWAALESGPGEAWVARPLGAPPGTEARRLASAAERLWLASDRGLLEAAGLGGPWRRVGSQVGGAASVALAVRGEAVVVASEDGVFEGALGAAAAATRRDAGNGHVWEPRPGEPSVQIVQRAALSYLDLGPGRMRALHRRALWRGWLPTLELEAGRGLARSRERASDQVVFASGLRDELLDTAYDRSFDSEMFLSLSWDLGEAAFSQDTLDVSKEAREVIELRDDVLDEITQLYFERRRVLVRLAALGTDAGEEAALLRLRADELAAGLDAWTGGWFSSQTVPLALRPSHPVTDTKE